MPWEPYLWRTERRPLAPLRQEGTRDAATLPAAGARDASRFGPVTRASFRSARTIVLLTKYPEKEIESMPVLSKFYGIVIRMVFTRSFAAHFHAIYGQCELVVGISPLRVIQGDAPSRVCELVLEWAAQHQRELLNAWTRCGLAMPPQPIAPLQ